MNEKKRQLFFKLCGKIATDVLTTGVTDKTQLILNTEMLLAYSPGFKKELEALVKKYTGTIKMPKKPR